MAKAPRKPPLPPRKISTGTLVADKYQLLRVIGEGGNGKVWLADHRQLDARVVLKFTLEELNQEEESFFEKEVRALARFSNGHPNIANILDAGVFRSQSYLVIQYLGGGSLDRYLPGRVNEQRQGAAETLRSLEWLQQIASALDYIHGHGLIHQDVKPANILLDESLSAYLADFGIAGQLQMHASTPHKIYGSIAYIAPEIFAGQTATPRTDQFSLGVTAFEFLLGAKPFPGQSREEIMAGQQQSIQDLAMRLGCPPALAQVFEQTLAADPARRFSSCRELAERLGSEWASRPPLVEPPPLPMAEPGGNSGYNQPAMQREKPPLPTASTDGQGMDPTVDLTRQDVSAESGDDPNSKESHRSKKIPLDRIFRRQPRK